MFISAFGSAQKLGFLNWSVEDGLIQSQVTAIAQDKYKHLWFGTEKGVSRFDGNQFVGYTTKDGLGSNSISSMLCDSQGMMWFGTNNGVTSFDGTAFRPVVFDTTIFNMITSLFEDRSGEIIAFDIYHNLFTIRNNKAVRQNISGDPKEIITAVHMSRSKELLVYVYQKGLYVLSDKWRQIAPDFTTGMDYVRRVFISREGDTLLAPKKGLLTLKSGKILSHALSEKLHGVVINAIAEDNRNNLWLGTESGAFLHKNGILRKAGKEQGLTNRAVNHIFLDSQANIWLCTDADGVYKYTNPAFTRIDASTGLSGDIISGVTASSGGQLYTAVYGGELYTISEHDSGAAVAPVTKGLSSAHIIVLCSDDQDNIWISTRFEGILKYNPKYGLSRVKLHPEISAPSVICLRYIQGKMYAGSVAGLHIIDASGKVQSTSISEVLVTCISTFDQRRLLISTSRGSYLVNLEGQILKKSDPPRNGETFDAIYRKENRIFIGTSGKGVVVLDTSFKQIDSISTRRGLSGDAIYSIEGGRKNGIWVGTGQGISNITFHPGEIVTIDNFDKYDGLFGMECSFNCTYRSIDSTLYFGTNRGLYRISENELVSDTTRPFCFLKSVRLFSKSVTDSDLYVSKSSWFDVPEGLTLSHDQNHLTFELGSIYYSNPKEVTYRYKLIGSDDQYNFTSSPFLTYPNLSPGTYTLEIEGVTRSSGRVSDKVYFIFIIRKAFYQTVFFRLVVVFLLIGVVSLITYLVVRSKHRVKQRIEQARTEEGIKLRQRTAEDFHDELGNSLTRISVLSDLLKSRIGESNPGLSGIISQIKENSNRLYQGAREIIWSLDTKSENLFDIAEHLQEVGIDFFEGTATEFQLVHNIPANSKDKMNFSDSRNFIMIFKECFSNILKHAGAKRVEANITLTRHSTLAVEIRDDGTGFDTTVSGRGNGITNMQTRAERLQAVFTMSSGSTGTTITLVIPLHNKGPNGAV